MSILGDYHQKFIRALIDSGVRYLIVGGFAAIYYGVRRGTGDLDVLVDPTPENGARLLSAFKALQLEVDEVSADEFSGPLFLGIGFEPDAVDIFTFSPAINFEEALRNSVLIKEGDLELNLISLDDLIRNKEHLNRGGEKQKLDEYDLEVLRRIRSQTKTG